jgi:hypothetical protein
VVAVVVVVVMVTVTMAAVPAVVMTTAVGLVPLPATISRVVIVGAVRCCLQKIEHDLSPFEAEMSGHPTRRR